MRNLLASWVRPVVLLGLAGCGLVSNDIADFTFRLPDKHYAVDAGAFPTVPAGLPAVACTVDTECACPSQVDCSAVTLACRQGACAAVKRLQLPATVNLATEAPEFKNVQSQRIARFEFKSLNYTVASTMNVALPAVDVYVAPEGVTSVSDPAAQKLGTIPATPAGATVTDSEMTLVPGASDVFSQYAQDWAKPFNFIAVADVTVGPGQVPTGKVDVTVWGFVLAKLSL